MAKRYEKYKDSGIAWIGEIPEHWEVIKMRFLCSFKTGDKDTINKEDDGKYPFYVRSPKIERINTFTYDGEAVLMAGDGVGAGKVIHYVNGKFDYHQRVYNFHKIKKVQPYLLYLFLQSFFSYKIEEGGAKNTVDSVRLPMIKDFPIVIPTSIEQEQIAKYLDWKCGEIDRIVEVRERQIRLLGELRTSVISRAVTRGLNPNAPLKDSGIDWIAQIPEHWETIKLKYIFTFGKGLNITKEDLVESGMPVISYGQIHSKENHGTGVKESLKRFVNGDYLKTNRQSLVNNNDFIFADTSEDLEGVGNCVFVDNNEMLFAGYHTITLKVKNMQHNKYLAYLFLSDLWRTQIRSRVTGVKVFSITKTILNFNTVLLPPIAEQQQIAEYLDSKTAEIDSTIDKFKVQIDKLKEYRQALVTEVVTGKIDVRGIEIPTPKSN